MSKVNPNAARSPFFPNAKNQHLRKKVNAGELKALQRNDGDRAQFLKNNTSKDANVSINEGIKDFSRIKKAVDAAPSVDNSEKIARLKSQVQNGTYQMDYDAIADKILNSEY